jgi:uncharacterized protein
VSERDGYEPGVPCWVDTWQPDPEGAVAFYTQPFGWEAKETSRPDSPDKYFMCRLRGRDVAAVGTQPPDAPGAPGWGTYVWVESADQTAAQVSDAGGRVVMEPFEALAGVCIIVVADPAGAAFGLWQPGGHRGAQLVNEPGAWSMSQLNTDDAERANTFYAAVFGWETDTFETGDGEITMWRVPGYVGGEPEQPVSREVVAVMAPTSGAPAEVPPHWSVDFWVDDPDATAAKAAELAGEAIVPPFDTPVGRTAVLADPQGASFSVSKVIGRR